MKYNKKSRKLYSTVLDKSALDSSGSIKIGTISSCPSCTPEANIIVKERSTRAPVPPIPNIYNFAIPKSIRMEN